MTSYNPNALALNLLKTNQANRSISFSVPFPVFKEALRIASLYEKNNPIMYVMDFFKARIIKTSKAEYDLLLSSEPNRFSKPYMSHRDLFDKFVANIKHKIQFTFPNDPKMVYTVN